MNDDERSMKHLFREFDALRARFPAGFESSLVLPCLRRVQEDRGFVADSDIDDLVGLSWRPADPDRGGAELLHAVPPQADRPLAHPGLSQRVLLVVRRGKDHRAPRRKHSASGRDKPRPTGASRCRRSSAWPRAAARPWC